MYVFLIVILVLAALLELMSLRGGSANVRTALELSEKRIEPGAEASLSVTAENVGRLPVSYLCVKPNFPLCASFPGGVSAVRELYFHTVPVVFRLWGRQKKTRQLSFRIEKRGVHRILVSELEKGDFLGLRTVSEQVSLRRDLLVYPSRLESGALLEALGADSGELSARRWLLRDPILTLGVREYTGTEPMRTISWTQTARRGELTVREFDYTRSMNCCVMLCVNGLKPEDEALLDRCCSIARTVCEELTGRGITLSLFTNASLFGYGARAYRSCTAAPGKPEDALELLTRAQTVACSPARTLAEAVLNAAEDAAAFLMIVPRRTGETEAAAELLRERTGLPPLVIAADGLEAD